jgi:mannose-6-phosphate isomerase
MHLLEAALAWMAADDDPAWLAMADELAGLCLGRMIEPATGALRESFDSDWARTPDVVGQIVEPGHLYEWAFLLNQWAGMTGRARPAAVSRLIEFADAHGLDRRRGVAINAVLADGRVHDPVARLWAQAERIRAYSIDRHPASDARLDEAIRGLSRFFTGFPGLWFDQLTDGDQFVIEPARATSLYHVVGAVEALMERGRQKGPSR